MSRTTIMNTSKTVWVGNIPYGMTEVWQDQIIEVFGTVGKVVGLRLGYDKETRKSKGYCFCEYNDHETARSAVRRLHGHEVRGRRLRVNLADSDPSFEGKTTVRGEIVDGETRAQLHEREGDEKRTSYVDPNAFLADVPKGIPLPPGTDSLDAISHVLATTDPDQLIEVLAQMKAFVITHPKLARALLTVHPQLGYALFQALLLHKIVGPEILNRMLAATGPGLAAAPSLTQPVPQYTASPPDIDTQVLRKI